MLSAERSDDLGQVDVLAMATIETEGMNPQTGIDHRANCRVTGRIELLRQGVELVELCRDYMALAGGVKSTLSPPMRWRCLCADASPC